MWNNVIIDRMPWNRVTKIKLLHSKLPNYSFMQHPIKINFQLKPWVRASVSKSYRLWLELTGIFERKSVIWSLDILCLSLDIIFGVCDVLSVSKPSAAVFMILLKLSAHLFGKWIASDSHSFLVKWVLFCLNNKEKSTKLTMLNLYVPSLGKWVTKLNHWLLPFEFVSFCKIKSYYLFVFWNKLIELLE